MYNLEMTPKNVGTWLPRAGLSTFHCPSLIMYACVCDSATSSHGQKRQQGKHPKRKHRSRDSSREKEAPSKKVKESQEQEVCELVEGASKAHNETAAPSPMPETALVASAPVRKAISSSSSSSSQTLPNRSLLPAACTFCCALCRMCSQALMVLD